MLFQPTHFLMSGTLRNRHIFALEENAQLIKRRKVWNVSRETHDFFHSMFFDTFSWCMLDILFIEKLRLKSLFCFQEKKKSEGICQKYFLLRTFQTLSAFLTSLVPQETLPCDDRATKKENGKWLLKTTQFALHVCTKCRPDGSSVTTCTKNCFESNNLMTS